MLPHGPLEGMLPNFCEPWLQVLWENQIKRSCRLVGMVAPRSHVGYSTNPLYVWFLDSFFGNGWMERIPATDSNQECKIGYNNFTNGISQCLANTRKLGNRKSSEGLRSFKPSNGTNLITLFILAGDIEMNQGPKFQWRLCEKYCKASDKVVECEDCEKRFHISSAKLGRQWTVKIGIRKWLVVLRLNVPVNNFSVMSGRSHRFLGN